MRQKKREVRRKEVVNGLANDLAAESPPPETQEWSSSRVEESRQLLLSQQRPTVLDIHTSPRQFLPQSPPFFTL